MSGKLFVVEGLDGSGKQTQSQLLYERLKKENFDIMKVEFPNYASESSSLVKMYLRGDFGTSPEDVSAYVSSTFFAADRYATYKTSFEEFYKKGGMIIADRYTTSNMVHQSSKIRNNEEKEKFLNWLWELEFKTYAIPVPEQVFFLDVPTDVSIKLMADRLNKFSHDKEKDIHENDAEYLRHSYETALWLVQKYGWVNIPCTKQNELLNVKEINDMLYKAIKRYI